MDAALWIFVGRGVLYDTGTSTTLQSQLGLRYGRSRLLHDLLYVEKVFQSERVEVMSHSDRIGNRDVKVRLRSSHEPIARFLSEKLQSKEAVRAGKQSQQMKLGLHWHSPLCIYSTIKEWLSHGNSGRRGAALRMRR